MAWELLDQPATGRTGTHDLNQVRFRSPNGLLQRATIGFVHLAALAVFILVELAYSYFAFPTPWAMLGVAAVAMVFRAGEVWFSRRHAPETAGQVQFWAGCSVGIGLIVPFALAAATKQFHTHYFGLLILPVLEAALYFSLPMTLSIAGLASCSTFLWVAYAAHFRTPFQLGELLEATTVSLLLITVAALVWSLLALIAARDAELSDRLRELKEAQDRLTEEERLAAVGRLASAVAHEIRNPVAIIRSAVEASAAMDRASVERETMDGIALTEARRLEKLTTDFLSYAQPGSRPHSEVDVSTFLGYIASLGRAQALGKDIEIRLVVGDGCCLFGNEDQLQQAMLNLIRNAIDASPEGRTVVIHGERVAEHTTISVENAGSAIPFDTASKIFEPFFTAKSGGTGLGLSIAKKIAESHGGTLTLAENRRNCIRFDLVLPATDGTSLRR